jgi:hypothetical protein
VSERPVPPVPVDGPATPPNPNYRPFDITAALSVLATHTGKLADQVQRLTDFVEPTDAVVVATLARTAVPATTVIRYWHPAGCGESEGFGPRVGVVGWAVWSDGQVTPIVYDAVARTDAVTTVGRGISWELA